MHYGVRPTSSLFKGLSCNVLSLASFGGAPYSLDEPSTVKCVVKAGCDVCARTHIAREMCIDLPDIDRHLHSPVGDRGCVGFNECDV